MIPTSISLAQEEPPIMTCPFVERVQELAKIEHTRLMDQWDSTDWEHRPLIIAKTRGLQQLWMAFEYWKDENCKEA